MSKKIPPSLRVLIESPRILKLGVGIEEDAAKVRRDFGIEFHGAVELTFLARTFNSSFTGDHPKSLISLARLTEHYIGLPLKKSKKVVLSNWECPLTENMIKC
ncbi:ribonuclease H-like domain-containing protein [Cantharellus anzutake]|uniref:ribonuclease H-like domain-containing protein n=1 Tax=Cantharellus anzutake TaxID=1750568 RepID=UPI001904616E|nr:ribonuclease H-like domain-containing protein [Cantharellus anzutake]KAF8323471.1 ribonuclease H-like domain-containing protein [Cantharellus anzutake]